MIIQILKEIWVKVIMSEIKNCTTCSFNAPASEWILSAKGKKFSSCVKCREYHRNHRKHDDEARVKHINVKNNIYIYH